MWQQRGAIPRAVGPRMFNKHFFSSYMLYITFENKESTEGQGENIESRDDVAKILEYVQRNVGVQIH